MSHPHDIRIATHPKRLTVRFAGRTIAETTQAKALHEGPIPPVLYVPRSDVDMNMLTRTETTTHCPFKGDASYYSLKVGDQEAPDAVWTYEDPKPEVAPIKDHLAFYASKVEIAEGD